MSWFRCVHCGERFNGGYANRRHQNEVHPYEARRDELARTLRSMQEQAANDSRNYEDWRALSSYLNIPSLPDAVKRAINSALKGVTPQPLTIGYGPGSKTYTVEEWYEMVTKDINPKMIQESQAALDVWDAALFGPKEPKGV